MSASREEAEAIARLIRELLARNEAALDGESVTEIRHYLDHDEYEMAFEGLFLSLMARGRYEPAERPEVYLAWAERLGLARESVFAADFWERLSRFLARGGGLNGIA